MQTDLLIPFLFADTLLAFEGVDTAHAHVDIGQTDRQRRVLGALRDGHVRTDAPWAVWETLRVVDGTAGRVLRIGLHVVVTVDVTAVVTTGLKVHARREIVIRIGLAILRVRPLHAQVLRHTIIGHIFLARHVPTIIDAHISAELIPLHILARGVYRPRAARVNIAPQLQVKVVIDRKIISQPLQIHTAGIVVTKVRHDQSTRILARKRKESKRNSQRQWHLAHHQIRRTCGNETTGLHLRLGHLQIEVRVVVVVAGGIFTALHHQHIALGLFGFIGYHIALALLRHHMANDTLLGLEVIRDLIRLVTILAVLKHGLAHHLILYRIHLAARKQGAAVHANAYVLRRQFHRLVAQLAIAVHKRQSIARHHHRVLGGVLHTCVNRSLLRCHTIHFLLG